MKIAELFKTYPNLKQLDRFLYLHLLDLWEECPTEVLNTTCAELGEELGYHAESIRKAIREISGKLIIYCGAEHKEGIKVLWVRQTIDEKMPDSLNLKRKHLGFYLIDPQGKRHQILPGHISRFCDRNGLDARHIWKLRNGRGKSHKDWRIG